MSDGKQGRWPLCLIPRWLISTAAATRAQCPKTKDRQREADALYLCSVPAYGEALEARLYLSSPIIPDLVLRTAPLIDAGAAELSASAITPRIRHSLPNSPHTLFLDFDGDRARAWN